MFEVKPMGFILSVYMFHLIAMFPFDQCPIAMIACQSTRILGFVLTFNSSTYAPIITGSMAITIDGLLGQMYYIIQ